jgi:hypothetical protein
MERTFGWIAENRIQKLLCSYKSKGRRGQECQTKIWNTFNPYNCNRPRAHTVVLPLLLMVVTIAIRQANRLYKPHCKCVHPAVASDVNDWVYVYSITVYGLNEKVNVTNTFVFTLKIRPNEYRMCRKDVYTRLIFRIIMCVHLFGIPCICSHGTEQSCFVLWRSRVQISTLRPSILTAVFLSLVSKMPW